MKEDTKIILKMKVKPIPAVRRCNTASGREKIVTGGKSPE
jgi:hypothetical protein